MPGDKIAKTIVEYAAMTPEQRATVLADIRKNGLENKFLAEIMKLALYPAVSPKAEGLNRLNRDIGKLIKERERGLREGRGWDGNL